MIHNYNSGHLKSGLAKYYPMSPKIYNNNQTFISVFNCGGAAPFVGGGCGSFWGGFGFGLANGLMNWAGGLLNGFMGGYNNMFGGWGMPFMPWATSLGPSSAGGCTCGCQGNKSSKADNSSRLNQNTNNDDIDNLKFSKLNDKIDDLRNKSDVKAEDIKALYDEINKAKNDADNKNVEADKTNYDSLLKELKNLAGEKGFTINDDGTVTPITENDDPPPVENVDDDKNKIENQEDTRIPDDNNDGKKAKAKALADELSKISGVTAVIDADNKVKITGITFALGKSDITPKQQILDEIKKVLSANNDRIKAITINGYANSQTYAKDSENKNQTLSEDRAKNVYDYLTNGLTKEDKNKYTANGNGVKNLSNGDIENSKRVEIEIELN